MSLVRSFPILAFLLVLLSIVSVSFAQESVTILLVGGTLAAMSWFVTEGPRGRSLPRWVGNILMIALSLHAFIEVLKFPEADQLIGTMGRFGVWLTLIKLYDRKSARDHAHLLMLSLLLMLTGCMQSASLLYGIFVIVYIALGLYVLLLFQFYASYERSRRERTRATPAQARTSPSIKPIVGRHAPLHFRALAVVVALIGMAMSVFVFTLYPRTFGRGMLRELDAPSLTQTGGYNDEINLRDGGRINESRELAFTIDTRDPLGRPVALQGPVYLRGAVLELYRRGGAWRTYPRPASRMRFLDVVPPRMTSLNPEVPVAGDGITMNFEFVRPTDTFFSVYAPYAISTEDLITIRYVPDTLTVNLEHGQPIRQYTIAAYDRPREEQLETLMEGAIMRVPRRWDPIRAPARLALYDDSPRVAELARDILRDSNIPTQRPSGLADRLQWNRDVAVAFQRFLRSGDYLYTLDLGNTQLASRRRQDPVARFLLETKRGHCEYFASALAALCHSVRAQARVVTGYVVLDYDKVAERYNVLESNAHAWVEVRTSRLGWERFDPTPQDALFAMHASDNSIADRLRWMYQQFEEDWNNNVVEFDSDSQSKLADSLDQGWAVTLERRWQDVRQEMARINQAFALGPTGYIWMGTIGFALILAIIVFVRLVRRIRTIRRRAHLEHLRGKQYRSMVRQVGFYVDMLNVLHRARLTKPAWAPPQLYGEQLEASNPQVASWIDHISRAFYRVRYGGESLPAKELDEVNASVDALAQHLKVKR
ncbi:MAG: transglutaminaseTgpA domain-containing protein [Planctomycetota bacterium]